MKALTFALVASLVAAASASAEVSITLQNGRVSIVAKDATARQILAEWARVGQTKIVNVERIPGGPMTIELTDVPEGQALDVLLRNVSGYLAAPRAVAAANLSVFDRVIVMPTSAAPRPAVSAQPPAPAFQQPQFAQPTPPADDDADEPPAPNVPGAPRGAPVFNSFPPPQTTPQNPQSALPTRPGQVVPVPQQQQQQPGAAPQQPVTYPSAPTAPATGGVATPGMIVAPPQQPNGQPVRRPGGPGGDREQF
jgi:hypothetical protein